jgi:beta-glucosidase
MTGSAIAMPLEISGVPVILNAWYGGQSIGTALSDVIFGRYNPSGRLPVTFYAGDADLPPFDSYSLKSRTYRYFEGRAQFPFGYGLSFTHFQYSWQSAVQSVYTDKDVIRCSFVVKNVGAMDGDEVAQVYIKYPSGGGFPLKELRHFSRVSIGAGQSAVVQAAVPVESLSKWDAAAGALVVPKGVYTIFAGGSSDSEAALATFEIK